MHVFIKSCNLFQIRSKLNEKLENYICLYSRELKAIDDSHFRLCDITALIKYMHKQNNKFRVIHFNFVTRVLILLLKIIDFEKNMYCVQ